MAGACGSCTLCCEILAVTELQKPRNRKCASCTSKGCGIYETRPQSCADFECLWLVSKSYPTGGMPTKLRPDRSHVILYGGSGNELVVDVDPRYPNAWRTPQVMFVIDQWRKTSPTPVVVAIGEQEIRL